MSLRKDVYKLRKGCVTITTSPIVLCAPSRKNVRSQGLTLIQVRSVQLPALAHHVSADENSLQRNCKFTRFLDSFVGCAILTLTFGWTHTVQTTKGSKCMKIEACILHLCCKASRWSSSARAMEGGSEKEGKVFCDSPPPHQSKGEMSQPKGGKNITRSVQNYWHAIRAALVAKCIAAGRVRSMHFKVEWYIKGQLHFLLKIFPFAEFLVRRCSLKPLTQGCCTQFVC